jgi:hypothetical protein
MAGFLGYLAQSTDFVSGPHSNLPFPGYTAGLTPPEQWDAIPLIGKAQIIVAIGMLESYGEILPVHYTKGGKPGYYPPIKGNRPGRPLCPSELRAQCLPDPSPPPLGSPAHTCRLKF